MANLIGAAYKWRIDNNVYSYITNTEGGDPFVVSGSTKCNEELIRNKVQNFTQEQYETKFQEMVSAVHAYDNGKYSYVQFLDYTIYMNECEHCDIYNRPDLVTDIDFTVSSTTLPSDSEATVGVHTTDNDIEYREGEKTRKYHINFGIPKGSRFIPIRVTDEELLQNGEQIIRDNDILAGDFVISVDSTTIWSCGKDYQFINSGVQLNASTYRYFADINAYSFGEGDIAKGVNSITEGGRTKTIGQYTHAEGKDTTAQGEASHAEGLGFDEANGDEKKAIIKRLNNTDKLNVKNTYGIDAEWVQPTNALVDGKLYDIYTADGKDKLCSMTASLFDQHHLVFDKYGGNGTWNRTGALFSVDNNSVLSDGTTYVFKRRYGAFGSASHTEGVNAFAYGDNSHAEGDNSMAIGKNSHAEGSLGGAYGNNSHVEGAANTANGSNSHAEGRANTASGKASHAEGDTTLAIGDYSHAEGFGNVAKNKGHHVSGTYAEIDNTGNAIFQVGIGDDDDTRRDAFRINKDGSFVFAVPENMDAPIFTFHPNIAQQEASAINEDEGEGDSVQTYNMRRSAPRQTSVSVTTSNFLDLINLQDNINNAIDGILPGIEEDLSNLRNNFDDIIDEQEQNYNETIAEILIKTSDIQSQIDGEATAWFFKGAPCDEWGTIDENKEPAKDWNKDGTNGKESYASHKGDTYTDITEKENGEIGKSWRFCYCERKIGAGENQKTTDWHWHEIGDASVARALYEASRAQSTADGKSTVYISKDEDGNRVPDHYQAGDMWIINETALEYGEFDHDEEKNIYYTKEINEDDEVQRGTPISVGEMLTSNANSKEYNVTHWSKEIKYTDDSYIIEAELATQAAYAAAEERHKEALQALERLNEIGRDGRVYATEFDFLNSQIGVISGDTNELVGADGTQGEASLWEGMVDSADEYFNAANSAKTALEYYTNEENFDIDAKTQNRLDYIQIRYENYYNWKYITHYYIARQELLNDIADASKNYSSGIQGISNLAALNASAAQNAADEAAEGASAALGMLDDVDNDNVVAITEFAALESELEVIERDLTEISNSIKLYEKSDLYGKLTGDTAEYEISGITDTPVTYKGYKAYQTAQIKAVNALKYHCGKTVESDGVSVTAGERKDDKNEFGSIKIRSPKEGMNNETTILGVDVNYENIVDYYGIRQSMLDHIAFVAKLYAESLQPDLSPENVAVILGQINMDGVNLITGSRCDFAMSQWGSTNKLTIKSEVNNYTETQINEDSKLSFCTCLYHPDPDPDKNVDVITNKQWEGEYISASIDVFIPKDNVTEEDKKNPKKVNFGIVLRNGDVELFSAYTTNIACVYNDWTRLKLTFHMEKDVTDVFTKDGTDYLVDRVYLVVYDADSTYKFTTGTKFKFRKIQIEFNTSCSSWYPSPEDVDEIYSVAVDAQTNANAAKKEAEASMNILTDMSDDGKLTPQEKVNIIKEWGEIQEEYEQASIDVKSVWEDHAFQQPDECTEYFDIYNVLNDYLGTGYTGDKYTIYGNCDINLTGVTTDISGHTMTINNEVYTGKNCFNKVFSTYYAKHVAFMNCLAEQLAYLEVRSVKIGGVNLLRNSSFTNLTDGSDYDTNTYWIYNQSSYTGSGSYSLSVKNGCLKLTSTVPSWDADSPRMGFRQTKYNINEQPYVLSFDAYADKEVVIKAETGYGSWADDKKVTITTERKRHTVLITGKNGGSNNYNIFFLRIDNNVQTSIYFDDFKLEEGNIATAWSMAPEDQMAYIDNVNNYVQELEESLQNQIDGVVNSYFMEGAPCDADGTVRTTIEPFSEWKSSYEVSNNIYTLKSGEINHLMDHLGDTYTNISDITLLNSSMWEIGGIGVGSDNYKDKTYDKCKYADSKRLRLKNTIECKAGSILFVPSGYDAYVSYYNDSNVYNGNSKHYTANGAIEDKGTRMSIQFIGSSDASVEQADTLKLSLNPTAGQSWRWCDITSTTSHETTSKYITVKYTSNSDEEISKNLHWHKIADSDAVRALQAAAAAQDTADGKRRVFTNQPYTPYDEGDLWVKTDTNNSGLTDTLYCIRSKATGDCDTNDWASSTVAQDALNGLNNLDISTRNLAIFSTASGINVTKINPYTFKQISADTAALCNFKIQTYNNNKNQESLYLADSTSVGTYKFTKTLTKTCNRINIGDNGSSKDTLAYFYLPETLYSGDTISFTYTVTNATNGSVTFKDVMIVKGNKAVAFQPSPEDIEASIVVGGRNILRNTRSLTMSSNNTHTFKDFRPTVPLKPDTEYVFSVDSINRHSGTTTGVTFLIYGTNETGYTQSHQGIVVPISNERKFVKFKTNSSVTSTDTTLIYCGIAGSTSGNSMTLQKFKLEEGNVPTEWSAAPEDIDYLQDIMNHGSTEVNGGLVMTNVLALKDTNDKVTGGISGVENDNVLLWGGGTYYDAKNAASTDYLKEDGNKITTLLRSNGTGKIGVFKISDTQAIVDVPNQGKVVIDASDGSGGIRVLNSSGKINTAILPSSIESYKPKQTTSNTTSGSKTHSAITSENYNVTGSSVTLTLGSVTTYPPSTSEEKTVTYTKRMTNTLTCTSITAQDPINISGSVTRVYGGPSQTRFDESKVTVKCSLRVNGTEVKSCSATKTFASSSSTTGNTNRVTFSSKNIFLTGNTKPALYGGTNTVTMVVTVTLASSAYAGKLDTINLKVTGGRTIISYACTTRTEYLYQPMTIIGNDGLVSLVNKDKYFMVDNSGSTQKIYAKGLSTTKGTAGSGELYISDNLLTAFDQLITTLKNIVNGVRSIGNNEDNATAWGDALDRVNQLIKESGIIANS